MHKIFLGLGSNVGDKSDNIQKAVQLLADKIDEITLASVYETKPIGYVEQENFYNTALVARTRLTPFELLLFVKDMEREVGRVPRFRWGPREIDIDVLFYDDVVLSDDTIHVPHPRLHERDFVLKPLLDLDPTHRHPKLALTMQELYERLPDYALSVVGKVA